LVTPANLGNPVVLQYLGTAAAASSVALNRRLPASPLLGGGLPVFPGSTTVLPSSFVGLNSLVGNFPVSEGTSLYSLRLDHRITENQTFNMRVGVSPSTVTGIQVNAQGPQNFGENAFSRTSQQTYRDFIVSGDHIWTIGANKVNEFRVQGSRRGLLYNFSSSPGGDQVGVNIPGVAFFGREPFSFVRRTEKRFQFADTFAITKGAHNFKFGADINYLPLVADFTVNFGGLYNFGALSASQVGFPAALGFPDLSPVQAYGLGIPQNFIQGVGNPHDEFSNKTFGGFLQDTWRLRSNLTANLGIRYDVELTPVFPALNAISQAAQDKLGITQGIPRDYNNFAPRIGLAWDPFNDGKTVVRASYGLFYDHPLLALAFDSDVADATQAPQIVLFPGTPGCNFNTDPINTLGAINAFRGTLGCLPAGFGYQPSQQRFNASLPNSLWVNQNYLAAGVPLTLQPFGFPVAKNFQYAYANQANLSFEQDLGNNYALSLEYNFNGGRHLNRPINANTVRTDLLVQNWQNVPASLRPADPRFVTGCGINPATGKAFVPAAAVSFFRQSGLNPSFRSVLPPACLGLINQVMAADGLGFGVDVPFSDMPANFSNGSSVYHALTVNLRKRMKKHYEFLASYTWSHTIDDSTDLQSPLVPQNNFRPDLERSNSLFDQRHRFVLSGVFTTAKMGGNNFAGKFLSDWSLAPIIDINSGRPFFIITGIDSNFDFTTGTDRPNAVPAGTPVNSCGFAAVPSRFSPTGFFQPPCFADGQFTGNLGRNAGTRPGTVFTDLRVSKRIPISERVGLDAMMDVFNVINRFNVADVNPLYTNAGQPTAAFDPRQFQFALKLSW
jgi:TonB dependent receptor